MGGFTLRFKEFLNLEETINSPLRATENWFSFTLRSRENVNLPSQATTNWYSSTLRSVESLNFSTLHS